MSLASKLGIGLGVIISLFSVVGTIWTVGVKLSDSVDELATKEYTHEFHTNDLLPLTKSVENIEAGVAVPRIQNILDLKCRTSIPFEVEDILQKQLARYKEIQGRDFNVGGCKDGKRITSYEAGD